MASEPRSSARPIRPDGPPAKPIDAPRPKTSDAPRPKLSDAPRPKLSDAPRAMTDAQLDYERKRAQKAGMSLDKWLNQKQKQASVAAPKPAKPQRKPGLISRLLDRAHQPLKKKS